MDAGKISGHVRANKAAGERRSLGSHWRHVGRARSEHAGWRVAGAPDSGGQKIFSKKLRRRHQDWLESRFFRIQLAASANLQEIWNRLFCDQQTAVGD